MKKLIDTSRSTDRRRGDANSLCLGISIFIAIPAIFDVIFNECTAIADGDGRRRVMVDEDGTHIVDYV